jgi:hypothetical protein
MEHSLKWGAYVGFNMLGNEATVALFLIFCLFKIPTDAGSLSIKHPFGGFRRVVCVKVVRLR